MKRIALSLVALGVLGVLECGGLLTAFNVWAAELYVPGSYTTIQAAVDACPEGGTVLVRPGVSKKKEVFCYG